MTAIATDTTQLETPAPNFLNEDGTANVDACACAGPKLVIYASCKTCAVAQGRYNIEVEPGQIPCPNCSDGRHPSFAYCTGCAIERQLIKADRTPNPDCPSDLCGCGNVKLAVRQTCGRCPANFANVTVHQAAA